MDIKSQHLAVMRLAVPERKAELDDLLAAVGVQIEFASDKPDLQLETAFGAILIGNRTPTTAWLVAKGAWESISAYAPAALAAGRLSDIDLSSLPDQAKHVDQINLYLDAAKDLLRAPDADSFDWPAQIPSPADAPVNVQQQVTEDIARLAWAFMLLHEVKHAELYASSTRPQNLIDEERRCDHFAITFMLEHLDTYAAKAEVDASRVRGLRAMGIATAMFLIAVLGAETQANHPPPVERFQSLLDALGAQPASWFWEYTAFLLFGALQRQGKPFKVSSLTFDHAGISRLLSHLT